MLGFGANLPGQSYSHFSGKAATSDQMRLTSNSSWLYSAVPGWKSTGGLPAKAPSLRGTKPPGRVCSPKAQCQLHVKCRTYRIACRKTPKHPDEGATGRLTLDKRTRHTCFNDIGAARCRNVLESHQLGLLGASTRRLSKRPTILDPNPFHLHNHAPRTRATSGGRQQTQVHLVLHHKSCTDISGL